MTRGVWEVRVYGRANQMRVQKVYTIVEVDFCKASERAKRLAKLDGVSTPVVWAAIRLWDAPEHRSSYLTDGRYRD